MVAERTKRERMRGFAFALQLVYVLTLPPYELRCAIFACA